MKRLPIQQRLPVLISVLLLAVIVIYGLANFYTLREATLTLGRQRLISINEQMVLSMSNIATGMKIASNAAVNKPELLTFLKSETPSDQAVAFNALLQLRKDSSWVSAVLLDKNLDPILESSDPAFHIPDKINEAIFRMHIGAGTTEIGKLYQIANKIYIPVVSSIPDNGKTLGYALTWKLLLTNQQTLDQFRQLIGSDATFYLGNATEDVWTDLVRPVSGTQFSKIGSMPSTYTNSQGKKIIAKKEPIAGTSWMMVTEFPQDTILVGTKGFLYWIVLIGIVLTGIGLLMSWFMSISITRPLKELTFAATEIANGDYKTPVVIQVSENDELGKLAHAFNVMKAKVSQVYDSLEKRIEARTAQLKEANRELEAFSYSVSHDLRMPLRAINGYSAMLKEEYAEQLDDEANRILNTIMLNAGIMGRLIDDLLDFARLSKKELNLSRVDMQQMVPMVVNELLAQQPKDKYKIVISRLATVPADSGMMKQVLLNIIGNAIKYASREECPTIEIGCAEGEYETTFYVRDNGVGFNMDYSDKLFGVFQRLHAQNDFEGTGVGLAFVKRILDKHNGTIRGEGLIGLGATFYFTLPNTDEKKGHN
jgi:signal transduction histidine kinase